MVRIKFFKLIWIFFFLTFIIKLNFCLAQEVVSYTTIVNRLTKVSLKFESLSPVEKEPIFVLPPKTKTVANYLKSDYKDGKYLYEWDLYLYFEKEGEYILGPFVFYDVDNRAISNPSIKFLVNNNENITLNPKKIKDSVDLPPKFFTVKSAETLFPYTPLYLILELNQEYEGVEIIWSGWENVFVERIPDEKTEEKKIQIRFLLIFTKSGNYNLTPIKFRVEKNNKSFLFSSSPLVFAVSELPQDFKNNGVGNFNVLLDAYTATNKNEIIIKTDYTGEGYFKFFMPKKPYVKDANVFLKDYRYDPKTFYPLTGGQLSFQYYFLPKSDGDYQVVLGEEKIFNPRSSIFKTLSSKIFNLKVVLPANPQESYDIEKKLKNAKKIDYDFYILITFLLLATFTVFGISIRNFFRGKSEKLKEKEIINKNLDEDELYLLLRSFLVILSKKSGEDLLIAPISKIEEWVVRIIDDQSVREDILKWLRDVYMLIYLKKVNFNRKELIERGRTIIKLLKG